MPAEYLHLMLKGYLITVLVEGVVLWFGLSRRHPWQTRLFAAIWLTLCTYPIVWLVLPAWIDIKEQRTMYLIVAETFAPAAECLLFWLAFGKAAPLAPSTQGERGRGEGLRDMTAIVVANLASFAVGELWINN